MSVRGTILTRRRRSTGTKYLSWESLRPLQTTWTGLASNPGLRREMRATNRLSHDTDDPFLRRAYTRVLSHVGLYRVGDV